MLSPLSKLNPEAAAKHLRVRALSEKLAARLHSSPDKVADVCSAFDQAVEFAALEGSSIAGAIAGFFEGARQSELGIQLSAFSCLVGASKNRSTVKGRRFPKITHKTLPRAIENLADLFISQGMHDLWAHSEAVARFARELAPLAGIDPERAYAAGLLHDIGRLALAKFPVTQKNMEQEWLAAGFPLVYAETLAYGRDHTAIGAECLCAWEVHPAIIEAVRLHHRPGRSGSGLSGLLTLAEDLAARGSGTGSEDLWAGMRRALACVQTGILPDELDDIGVGRLLLSAAKPLVSGAGA